MGAHAEVHPFPVLVQPESKTLILTCKPHLRGAEGLLRALQHCYYRRRQALRLPLRPLSSSRQLRALLVGNLLRDVRSCIFRTSEHAKSS